MMSHLSALSSKDQLTGKSLHSTAWGTVLHYISLAYVTEILAWGSLGGFHQNSLWDERVYACQTMNARSGDTCRVCVCVWPGPLWRLLCRQRLWEDSAAACSDTDDPATWTPLSWSSSNTPAPSERWLDRPLHHRHLDNTNTHTPK